MSEEIGREEEGFRPEENITFDSIIKLLGTDANKLFGEEMAAQFRNKYNDENFLLWIYNIINQSQLPALDKDIISIINKIPNDMDKDKDIFNTLLAELQKLQIYSFLMNCDKVNKDLEKLKVELDDDKKKLKQTTDDYDEAKTFINNLINAVNKKLLALNNLVYNNNINIQKGGHHENYQKKYLKYKIKYFSLKNNYKNAYHNTKYKMI